MREYIFKMPIGDVYQLKETPDGWTFAKKVRGKWDVIEEGISDEKARQRRLAYDVDYTR